MADTYTDIYLIMVGCGVRLGTTVIDSRNLTLAGCKSHFPSSFHCLLFYVEELAIQHGKHAFKP